MVVEKSLARFPSLKPAISSDFLLYLILPICLLASVTLGCSFVFGALWLLFFLHGRLCKRRGLGAIFVLFGVAHDARWVNGEWLLLEAELTTVSEIDLRHLTVVEEGVTAWPDEGAHDNDGVRLWHLDLGVLVAVLGCVTADTYRPAWLLVFLAGRQRRVLDDALEEILIGVGSFLRLLSFIRVERIFFSLVSGLFRFRMSNATVH